MPLFRDVSGKIAHLLIIRSNYGQNYKPHPTGMYVNLCDIIGYNMVQLITHSLTVTNSLLI